MKIRFGVSDSTSVEGNPSSPPNSDSLSQKPRIAQQPRAALSGLLSGLSTAFKPKREIARKVYSEQRLFHGTTSSNGEKLAREGFDISKKTDGAMQGHGGLKFRTKEELDATKTHHYLTSDKTAAKYYANLASEAHETTRQEGGYNITHLPEGAEPSIVRVLNIDSPDKKLLENDPHSGTKGGHNYETSFRTSAKIPAHNILGKKKSPPGQDALIFKTKLAQAGLKVSRGKAGKLLREVQSDDEGDF